MPAYEDQYVIVNIWTNTKNKALPGKNRVGHISITTPDNHMSLWPLRNQSRGNGFFNGDHGLFSPFHTLPTAYKPDYEQDCIMEGAAYHYRSVGAKTVLNDGEKVYQHDVESGLWKSVSSVPRASNTPFYGVTPINADFRMVLYSLDVDKIEEEFSRLKGSVKGWNLIGSSLLRAIQTETTESCSSLVYRCLEAGGFYSNLKSGLSCQTSSSVDPEDLLRHVVAAKEKELIDYPKTANWTIDGVEETSLDIVKKAYSDKGLKANVEDDMFPGFPYFGFSYTWK